MLTAKWGAVMTAFSCCFFYIHCIAINRTSVSPWNFRWLFNTLSMLKPNQNDHHFADNIFKCFFLNENEIILIENSLKFVPKNPINNISALVQIMACHLIGAKPLSEPILWWRRLPTHICITWPQWVNGLEGCRVRTDRSNMTNHVQVGHREPMQTRYQHGQISA